MPGACLCGTRTGVIRCNCGQEFAADILRRGVGIREEVARPDKHGCTVLHNTIENNLDCEALIPLLVECGAPLEAQDNDREVFMVGANVAPRVWLHATCVSRVGHQRRRGCTNVAAAHRSTWPLGKEPWRP